MKPAACERWTDMSVRWGTVAVFLVGSSAFGQEMKAGVMGNPKIGRPAPDFSALYLTSKGAGPEDQPFRLKAELGHVVVLIFGPQRGSTGDGWAEVATQAERGVGEKSIVVGAVRAPVRSAL